MADERAEAAVQEQVKRQLDEIEAVREEALRRGLAFTSISEGELAKKIRGETSASPFFRFLAWRAAGTPGDPLSIEVGYFNPDPTYWQVFVTFFFGLANFADDITAAISGRHPAWPYVSESGLVGTMQGGSARLDYAAPAGERGVYLGNAVLWGPRYFGVGTYLDRGLFDVRLL